MHECSKGAIAVGIPQPCSDSKGIVLIGVPSFARILRISVRRRHRVPALQASAAHTKEWLKEQIIYSVNYAHENGIDRPEIREWKWPAEVSQP